MKFGLEKYHRHSIRWKGYDYTQPGVYFVTICTQNRKCVLGDIVEGKMRLNDVGQIVQDEWFRASVLRPNVKLDVGVVMPNHIHGLVWIIDDDRGAARRAAGFKQRGDSVGAQAVGAQRAAPLRTLINVAAGSLGAIIRAFKSAATKRINEMRDTPGMLVWQRNYYEHVIRNESELDRIREYIVTNPARWDEDVNNSARIDENRRGGFEAHGVY